MKEQKQLKQTNLTENVRLVKVDAEKHLGRLTPHSGHTLFEYNKINFQLQKAKFEQINYHVGSNFTPKKVIIKDNCFYVSSLNAKNAIKQINKKFNPQFILVLADD